LLQLEKTIQATNLWESFTENARAFSDLTEQFVHDGINPGGYYKAVWCRDAAYILKDWFLSGRFEDVMREMLFIWSHQISADGERIIYGRGSPEMQYTSQVASPEVQKKFEGALPSTIFYGFSEVYGRNPDIDSTALMISTTSWILDTYLKSGMMMPSSAQQVPGAAELKMSSVAAAPSTMIDFVVPRMLRAAGYLASRDIDGDGLLEQGHNEDWMDTVLRAGKIVYSQACWILALGNLSSLLTELGRTEEASKVMSRAYRAIRAVERTLWSEKEGTYIDIQEAHHVGGPYKTLTQDVALYLVAITENTARDIVSSHLKGESTQDEKILPEFSDRGARTLDAMKSRIWKDKWPLVTEAELERTGPWVLHPNQYHNHTLWPWTTGIEMLARSRFGQVQECYALLSMLTSKDSQSAVRAYHEWVNPVTDVGSGAYPFRTGISAIRIAIADILGQISNGGSSSTSSNNSNNTF
jgi:glycogen debranching enzyme